MSTLQSNVESLSHKIISRETNNISPTSTNNNNNNKYLVNPNTSNTNNKINPNYHRANDELSYQGIYNR